MKCYLVHIQMKLLKKYLKIKYYCKQGNVIDASIHQFKISHLKKIFTFFILFFAGILLAQLQTANWYFGQYMGLKFQNNEAIPIEGGQLYTGEGCATISDQQGNLLFYTDGSVVFNRNHQIMQNGVGLKGNSSSTQSAIVIPFPQHADKYVIVTVSADDSATPAYTLNEGLNYYYVDMTMDNGNGAVIFPPDNNLLPLCSEKITAVMHKNGKDYWVITHFQDRFYAYLVTEQGVSHDPIQSVIGPSIDERTYPVNSRGYLKLSPNGKFLAVAHLSNLNYDDIPFDHLPYQDQMIPTNGPYANGYPGVLALYNFDKRTGIVSHEIVIETSGSPYGVEFSPDSQLLYANVDFHTINENNQTFWERGELIQYKVSTLATEVINSRNVIHTFQEMDTPSSLFIARGALQMGLNGRIYYTRDYKSYLSHIIYPNRYGNPVFEEVGVSFPYYTYSVNTRYGLPPFISSAFVNQIHTNGLTAGKTCLGNEVEFSLVLDEELTILSYQWNFGDGSTSTDRNPTHQFTTAGTFSVSVTLTSTEGDRITLTTEVEIVPPPVVQPAWLEACDTNQDGKVGFNLDDAKQQINALPHVNFAYYFTENDARLETQPISNLYETMQEEQIIWVRVTNETGCFSLTTITLKQINNTFHQLPDQYICSDGSSQTIDITRYHQMIEDFLATNSILDIQFYGSMDDLQQAQNPISTLVMEQNPIQVFARLNIFGNTCDEVITFKLYPSIIPSYSFENKMKCAEHSVTFQAPQGYTYQWMGLTGEDRNQPTTTSSIQIFHPGNYTLFLSNAQGCERRIDFTVNNYPITEIVEVRVVDNSSIRVQAIGENLMYSLDGVNWQHENVFVKMNPGQYIVYVKNQNGCVVHTEEIVIFQWNNFLSPNQDHANDTWKIPGLEKYENVEVEIYDRYGKVILQKVMRHEQVIWDGKYQLKKMPSDSYWYTIKIPTHTIYSGFVLLKNKG